MERTWSAVHLWTVYIVPHILLCVNTFWKISFSIFQTMRPDLYVWQSYHILYHIFFDLSTLNLNFGWKILNLNFPARFSISIMQFISAIQISIAIFQTQNTNFDLKSKTQISISILRLFYNCEIEPKRIIVITALSAKQTNHNLNSVMLILLLERWLEPWHKHWESWALPN